MIRLEGASAVLAGAPGTPPRTLLEPFDLTARPGERHRVLGANGSGKTTLLRLLSGLSVPFSGRLLVDGMPVHAGASGTSLWPRVAVLFEEPDPQFLADTVEAEIAFGLESMALPPEETRRRVEEALERDGLAGMRSRDPRTLSAGEKARTLVAAALAARPGTLLLDQTLAHLDLGARREIEERLAAGASGERFAVVAASQDPEALRPGEIVHILEAGRLRAAEQLTPSAVLAARDVPLPMALRAAAVLAEDGRWNGPLPLSSERFRVAMGTAPTAGAPGASLPSKPEASEAQEPRTPLLVLSGVAWTPPAPRGSAPVLEDATLSVGAGEIVALVGVSGSGKSTILHLAAGLREATRGSVERAEPVVKRTPPVMLALEYPERQLFARTVVEDVAIALWVAGAPAEERARLAARALREVGLDPDRFGDRIPGTLSEGEKRRAALASFFVEPPLVLLLDEPTAGLDPAGRRSLRSSLLELRERGRAILLASHDLDFVSGVADRVVVLARDEAEIGRIAGSGAPEAVWGDAALMERAGLPVPEAFALDRILRTQGWLPPGRVRDGDSLLASLGRARAPLAR